MRPGGHPSKPWKGTVPPAFVYCPLPTVPPGGSQSLRHQLGRPACAMGHTCSRREPKSSLLHVEATRPSQPCCTWGPAGPTWTVLPQVRAWFLALEGSTTQRGGSGAGTLRLQRLDTSPTVCPTPYHLEPTWQTHS